MKTEFDHMIDVPEEPRADQRPTDVPVFSIEKSGSDSHAERSGDTRLRVAWKLVAICLTVLACVCVAGYIWLRGKSAIPDYEVSVTDDENITKLNETAAFDAKGSDCRIDSALGVVMELYPLDGLRASLEWEVPDTADRSLVLFTRSADYHPDGRTIGSIVVDGAATKGRERNSRPAYAAISPEGKMVIGVSTTDKIYDYAKENGGSFFRQYLLLSYGEMPRDFYLHGKTPRAAIGRMTDDSLYYIVAPNAETMYGFADALREYGFVDAIYITGGNNYRFSRDTTGDAHLDDATRAKVSKYTSTKPSAPFLVFRLQR